MRTKFYFKVLCNTELRKRLNVKKKKLKSLTFFELLQQFQTEKVIILSLNFIRSLIFISNKHLI